MKIGAIGYNYRHKEKFVMDVPNGTGCCLMLLIKEPSLFFINGKKNLVRKNSFVLFSPQTAYKYYANGEVYADDWIYFNFDDGEAEKFNALGIPADEIVYLGNIEELSHLVHSIAYEHFSIEEGHEEIKHHYSEIFLIKLSRLIKSKNSHSNATDDKHTRFMQLRNRIYALPDEIPTVADMAVEMGMSRTGFSHSYKRIFGTTVMRDIIISRIERSKQLLISTSLSIKDIAEKCGYDNEYSFMRQFKTIVGKTPTQFRSMS